MRTISATEASRHFSELLDDIESGATVTVTRGNRPVAEIRPAIRHSGHDLSDALHGTHPPDDDFAASIADAVAGLTESIDPWSAA